MSAAAKPEDSLAQEYQSIFDLQLKMKERDTPANFGELLIQHRGKNENVDTRRYVCLSDETDVMDCWHLLHECWKLKRPSLVLSVTGSAAQLQLEPWMRDRFQRGLATAVACSEAWVITGGTESGVINLVGEALGPKSTYPSHSKGRSPLIGVVPWMALSRDHRDAMHSKPRSDQLRGRFSKSGRIWPSPAPRPPLKPVELTARRDPAAEQGGLWLEPNHTHFMLVDDGAVEGQVYGEIPFRSELEQCCAQQQSVPLIIIVIQGGEGTFKTAAAALQNDCQAIFVRDSGGCAELVANFVAPLLQLEMEQVTKKDGTRKRLITERLAEFMPELKRHFQDMDAMKLNTAKDHLMKICMHLERINLFSFQQQRHLRAGRKTSTRPFDQVILNCFVQSSKIKTERSEQEEMLSRRVPKPLGAWQVMHTKCLKNHPKYEASRSAVPDGQVSWEVTMDDYKPPTYTHNSVLVDSQTGCSPHWADPKHPAEVPGLWEKRVTFWTTRPFSEPRRLSLTEARIEKDPDALDAPRNPMGRTGLKGRGLLGKWGPNQAVDPIVTRFHPKTGVLQLAAVLRVDTGEWAIPGGMRDQEGETEVDTMWREFNEEAWEANGTDTETQAACQKLFKGGGFFVYCGYVEWAAGFEPLPTCPPA